MEQGIPCRILGDRVVNGLCNLVRNRKASSPEDLEKKLKTYVNYVCKDALPYLQEQIRDKVNCIKHVLPQCGTVDEVETALKSLLKPTGSDHVRLATIHKSKGLESPNVWIIYPPVKSDKATKPDQILQESNVEFVAESRTSCNTYQVIEE